MNSKMKWRGFIATVALVVGVWTTSGAAGLLNATANQAASATSTSPVSSAEGEQRIVFVSNRTGSNQIWSMKPDGSELRQLTASPGNNADPRWSPDNQQIVFTSVRDGDSEIYVMNADGTSQTRLTHNQNLKETPEWTADGQRILFAMRDDTFHIWSMSMDGKDLKQISNTAGADDILPRSAPDGKKIAFGRIQSGKTQFFTMNLDGANPIQITNLPETSNYPTDWKGHKILFTATTGSISEPGFVDQVWSMNDDGSDQVSILGFTYQDGVFSPDMRQMAFTHAVNPKTFELLVARSDGTNQIPIAQGNDVSFNSADWSN